MVAGERRTDLLARGVPELDLADVGGARHRQSRAVGTEAHCAELTAASDRERLAEHASLDVPELNRSRPSTSNGKDRTRGIKGKARHVPEVLRRRLVGEELARRGA